MPSLSKVIRGAYLRQDAPVPLSLRYDFSANQTDLGKEKDNTRSSAHFEIIARARAQAEEILQQAQKEMEKKLEQARLEAEELARQAQEKAFQEGYQKGYQTALSEAALEAEAIREEARQILREVKEIRQKTLDSMESEIIALAQEIAEKIVATQLTLDPGVILAITREALELAQGKEQVLLYVNPDEKKLIQEREEELQQLLPPGAVLHILADPAVKPGGCRVETEDGQVDASLEARWSALLKAFYGREE